MTVDPSTLGIPQDALRRLSAMRPGQETSMFTSDLSVNEFLLVREAGFDRWGWSSARASTTSVSRPGGGARTRSS
jgi:hypothetical protein